MTKEEFDIIKNKIDSERNIAIRNLLTKYALDNNPYKVGDLIEDHTGKGIILKIQPTRTHFNEYSECIYYCDNLTKNGSISKREPTRWIYQSNILENVKNEKS